MTPARGAHKRNVAPAFREMPLMTRTVATAVNAGPSAMSFGASARRLNTTGSTVAGTSRFTVPTMVGVRSRRNRASRIEITIGTSDEAATKVASSAGPPWSRALTQTPMKAPAGPMKSRYPAPTRPSRTACRAVLMPLTATAPNTAQDRYASVPPPARMTMVGMKMMLVMPRTTSCRPQPRDRSGGGFSSGS